MSVTVANHPLARHRLTLTREADYSTYKFRTLTTELAHLMAYEVNRDFGIEKHIIDGWCGSIEGDRIKGKTLTIVPILCIGLGVLGGVLDLIPTAKISIVGLQRDGKTSKPVSYFKKFIDSMDERPVLTVDPTLATDDSTIATIDPLKVKGCRNIRALVLATASGGMKAINEAHPDITIYTAAFDSHLSEHGYTIPGLGGVSDKIFGTR